MRENLFVIGSILFFLLSLYFLYLIIQLVWRSNKAINIYLKKKNIKNHITKTVYFVFILLVLLFFSAIALPRLGIYYFLETEFSIENRPELYKVPSKLENNMKQYNNSYLPLSNKYFECVNPWGNYKIENIDDITKYIFDKDINLIVFNKDKNYLYSSFIRFLVGNLNIDEEYDLMKYQYILTPEKINYFLFLPQINYNARLLIIKDNIGPYKNVPQYFYESEKVKGFQYGSPRTDKRVFLELYDSTGFNYSIMISGEFNQDNINTLLFTMNFREG